MAWLEELGRDDLPVAGGKGANLVEMLRAGLGLASLAAGGLAAVASACADIAGWIEAAPVPRGGSALQHHRGRRAGGLLCPGRWPTGGLGYNHLGVSLAVVVQAMVPVVSGLVTPGTLVLAADVAPTAPAVAEMTPFQARIYTKMVQNFLDHWPEPIRPLDFATVIRLAMFGIMASGVCRRPGPGGGAAGPPLVPAQPGTGAALSGGPRGQPVCV